MFQFFNYTIILVFLITFKKSKNKKIFKMSIRINIKNTLNQILGIKYCKKINTNINITLNVKKKKKKN